MGTVTISTVLWDANVKTEEFSRCYTDAWADKFFSGFRRNLTVPTRCVLFTDRRRDLPANIEQVIEPDLGANGYGDCVTPFQLGEPMIFAGLDTVVIGNCDKFARYCFEADRIALPKHPYEPWSINGVVFCPAGQRRIFDEWRGENDMKWMRQFPHHQIDTLWPGRVLSYKAHVRNRSVGRAKIIYFHGDPKPDQLAHEDFVRRNWV
jgi:hypothetical protein